MAVGIGDVKHCSPMPHYGKAARHMAETPEKHTREERLAAKLRENLRRRKAQARATGASENAALSKLPPNR